MFNTYSSICNSSIPFGEIEKKVLFDVIQNGDENLDSIKQARNLYAINEVEYNKIKRNAIPCHTFNFLFEGRRTNDSISSSTGYIYLDIDDDISIDLTNPYIHASWLSLSETGRGVLVKAEGINQSNFNDSYSLISEELGLNTD